MEDIDREVRGMLGKARSVGRRKENKGEEGVPEHQVIVRLASTPMTPPDASSMAPWVVRTGFPVAADNGLARLDTVFSSPAVQQARFRRYRYHALEYRHDLSSSTSASSSSSNTTNNASNSFFVLHSEPVVERTMALYGPPPVSCNGGTSSSSSRMAMGVLVTRGPKPRLEAPWRFPWSTRLHDVTTVRTETVRLGLDATLVRETVDEERGDGPLQFVRVELGPRATWLHARTVTEAALQALLDHVQADSSKDAGGSNAAQRPNAASNLQRMR